MLQPQAPSRHTVCKVSTYLVLHLSVQSCPPKVFQSKIFRPNGTIKQQNAKKPKSKNAILHQLPKPPSRIARHDLGRQHPPSLARNLHPLQPQFRRAVPSPLTPTPSLGGFARHRTRHQRFPRRPPSVKPLLRPTSAKRERWEYPHTSPIPPLQPRHRHNLLDPDSGRLDEAWDPQ